MMKTIINELLKIKGRTGHIQVHGDISTIVEFQDFNVSVMKTYYGKELLVLCDENLEDFDNVILSIDATKIKKYGTYGRDLIDISTDNIMVTVECC